MRSISSNALFNGLNTLTSVIFPLITFPYAARVLMPDGIGTISFLNGIVSYIVLLTTLGIPLYAVKEIAKARDNLFLRNRITAEILTLSIALCILGYLIVWLCASFIPRVNEHAPVFYVLSLAILFTAIGVEWFYQAIEDFRYITIRALIVRTLAAASLFIFVHSPEDLLAYAFILVGSTIGNNLLNFLHLHKFGIFSTSGFTRIPFSSVTRHIKPVLVIFSISIFANFYLTLNSVMLGFLSDEEEVGYYSAAIRLIQILILVICSVGTVLVPRLSNLIATGNINEFSRLSKKSLRITLMLSLPVVAGTMILAIPIILVFCGGDYAPSIFVLITSAPVILLSALSALVGWQILYPSNKTHIVVIATGAGAAVNVALNFILIPICGCLGTAISLVGAEFTVIATMIISGRRFIPFSVATFFQPTYYLATLIMAVIVFTILIYLETGNIAKLIILPAAGCIIYAACLLLMRDETALELAGRFFNSIHRKR